MFSIYNWFMINMPNNFDCIYYIQCIFDKYDIGLFESGKYTL